VATGPGFGVDALRATGATLVLEQLPPPPEFAALLGLP
jgi:hypothetical protein